MLLLCYRNLNNHNKIKIPTAHSFSKPTVGTLQHETQFWHDMKQIFVSPVHISLRKKRRSFFCGPHFPLFSPYSDTCHVVSRFFYAETVARRCSLKRGFLKISQNSQGKHLCQSFFLNKVAGLRQIF